MIGQRRTTGGQRRGCAGLPMEMAVGIALVADLGGAQIFGIVRIVGGNMHDRPGYDNQPSGRRRVGPCRGVSPPAPRARPGSAKAVAPGRRPASGHRLPVDADRVVDAHDDEVARRARAGARPGRRSSRRGSSRPASSGAVPSPGAAVTPASDVGRPTRPGSRPRRLRSSRTIDLVERGRGERAVVALVLVAPVARDADDADRPARPRRLAADRAVAVRLRGLRLGRPSGSTKSASWRIPSTLWQ